MDIGNQQRVIIVELDKVAPAEPTAPNTEEIESSGIEPAVEWPLPFDSMPASPIVPR